MKLWMIPFIAILSACVSSPPYKDAMKPWIGATQDELVAKWSYPQATTDLVKIDDETTVFTYRSNRRGGPFPGNKYTDGREACVVSFVLKNKFVTSYKYEGGNCPRNFRAPNQ